MRPPRPLRNPQLLTSISRKKLGKNRVDFYLMESSAKALASEGSKGRPSKNVHNWRRAQEKTSSKTQPLNVSKKCKDTGCPGIMIRNL